VHATQEKRAGQKRKPKSFMLWFSIQKYGENCLCCPNQKEKSKENSPTSEPWERRRNSSSLMQFQLKRARGRARELLPFSWCNWTKREERVAKIREKPREKFERVSLREEKDVICERSHLFIEK